MKKTLIALAALTAGAAFAQSTVTISGGVALGYLRDGTNATAVNKLANYGAADSAITFAVVEDLGGGLKAAATINQRFDATNGASGNTGATNGFAQNVKLALSGGFGEVAAGRFNGPVDIMRGPLDFFNGAAIGVYGHATDAATRHNGTLQYTTPVFSGVKGTLAVIDKDNNTGYAANVTEGTVTYTNGPVYLGLGYTQNAGGLDGNKVVTLGGAYNFGVAKVALTYSDRSAEVATNDSTRYTLGVSAPVGANVVARAAYEKFNSKTDANDFSWFGVGADYILSKRTKLILDATKKDTASSVSLFLGAKHTF